MVVASAQQPESVMNDSVRVTVVAGFGPLWLLILANITIAAGVLAGANALERIADAQTCAEDISDEP